MIKYVAAVIIIVLLYCMISNDLDGEWMCMATDEHFLLTSHGWNEYNAVSDSTSYHLVGTKWLVRDDGVEGVYSRLRGTITWLDGAVWRRFAESERHANWVFIKNFVTPRFAGYWVGHRDGKTIHAHISLRATAVECGIKEDGVWRVYRGQYKKTKFHLTSDLGDHIEFIWPGTNRATSLGGPKVLPYPLL
jgi:hypothetical protein